MAKIAFIDLEIDGKGRILDIGGVKNGLSFHSARIPRLRFAPLGMTEI